MCLKRKKPSKIYRKASWTRKRKTSSRGSWWWALWALEAKFNGYSRGSRGTYTLIRFRTLFWRSPISSITNGGFRVLSRRKRSFRVCIEAIWLKLSMRGRRRMWEIGTLKAKCMSLLESKNLRRTPWGTKGLRSGTKSGMTTKSLLNSGLSISYLSS